MKFLCKTNRSYISKLQSSVKSTFIPLECIKKINCSETSFSILVNDKIYKFQQNIFI